MRRLFVDTLYWVALVNPRDQWHALVRRANRSFGRIRLVTTGEVLVEMLNALSGEGSRTRGAGVALVQRLAADPDVEIVPQTPASFGVGLDLYLRRPDKSYSMTDCISMATMRVLGLTEVLTRDRHFEQEGFRLVL